MIFQIAYNVFDSSGLRPILSAATFCQGLNPVPFSPVLSVFHSLNVYQTFVAGAAAISNSSFTYFTSASEHSSPSQ